MAITLDDTVGGASSNTYALLADADEYALSTVWESSWAGKTDAEKNSLLVRAARELDTIGFSGYPTADTQARQFPRTDAYYPSGNMWPTDSIPQVVKDAQMHIACYLSKDITADPFEPKDTHQLKRKKLIDVVGESEWFEGVRNTDGAVFLRDVIRPMFRNTGLLGPAGAVKLTR